MAKSKKHNIMAYQVYTAIISQSGTSDPVVTVLDNNIGNIVWTRGSEGTYNGTLANAFPLGKTWFAAPHNGLEFEEWRGHISLVRDSPSNTGMLLLRTEKDEARVDDALFNCSIEIRVYP